LVTPPVYAKLRTDSEAEFYMEYKYAKIYKVFYLKNKEYICPIFMQHPV